MVPFALRADRNNLVLPQVGDTARLNTSLLFASGDTIATGVGRWSSLDPEIVFVTNAGLAVGRGVGMTHLVTEHQGLADTVQARVVSGR